MMTQQNKQISESVKLHFTQENPDEFFDPKPWQKNLKLVIQIPRTEKEKKLESNW